MKTSYALLASAWVAVTSAARPVEARGGNHVSSNRKLPSVAPDNSGPDASSALPDHGASWCEHAADEVAARDRDTPVKAHAVLGAAEFRNRLAFFTLATALVAITPAYAQPQPSMPSSGAMQRPAPSTEDQGGMGAMMGQGGHGGKGGMMSQDGMDGRPSSGSMMHGTPPSGSSSAAGSQRTR